MLVKYQTVYYSNANTMTPDQAHMYRELLLENIIDIMLIAESGKTEKELVRLIGKEFLISSVGELDAIGNECEGAAIIVQPHFQESSTPFVSKSAVPGSSQSVYVANLKVSNKKQINKIFN